MGVLKKDGRETGARSDQKISLSPLALGPTQISLLRLRKKPGIASGWEKPQNAVMAVDEWRWGII